FINKTLTFWKISDTFAVIGSESHSGHTHVLEQQRVLQLATFRSLRSLHYASRKTRRCQALHVKLY
ncbi:MAG: hypothetical protein JXA16_15930, partial [Bacteroidales bacterium]|nr:hypothetical protein [Bacteroidales bacterium]